MAVGYYGGYQLEASVGEEGTRLIDKNLLNELEPGIVVHLCPKTMLSLGGKVTGPPETWVVDVHFFLVLGADAKRCRLLPIYSQNGPGRKQIPTEARRGGHPKWPEGPSYYHPVQVWTASRQSIVRAAHAGGDMSRSGSRGCIAEEFIPDL
jgi:hypothetical protein